jgi:hypothetical protein
VGEAETSAAMMASNASLDPKLFLEYSALFTVIVGAIM